MHCKMSGSVLNYKYKNIKKGETGYEKEKNFIACRNIISICSNGGLFFCTKRG